MDQFNRRGVLRIAGATGLGVGLAGCADEPSEPDGPDDDAQNEGVEGEDIVDEEQDPEADPQEEGDSDGEGDGSQDDGGQEGDDGNEAEYVEHEPDYGGWFDGVDNYRGTYDMTEREEVSISVGAGDDGLLFEPPAVRVNIDATVIWEWIGQGGGHNVTEENGVFESETVDGGGHTFEFTFEQGDRYRYSCTQHEDEGMKGAIIVAGADE